MHNLKFTFNPQGFIQINVKVNQLMIAKASDWLGSKPEDRVLDLFCGIGNFTLPTVKLVKYVIGVEGLTKLVVKAEYNAELNGITHVDFWQYNLEKNCPVSLGRSKVSTKFCSIPLALAR